MRAEIVKLGALEHIDLLPRFDEGRFLATDRSETNHVLERIGLIGISDADIEAVRTGNTGVLHRYIRLEQRGGLSYVIENCRGILNRESAYIGSRPEPGRSLVSSFVELIPADTGLPTAGEVSERQLFTIT